MHELDVVNETALAQEEAELTSEIEDLSAYLDGLPAHLRQAGAFRPYEVRLQRLVDRRAEISRKTR
jgi:hypothetical protein